MTERNHAMSEIKFNISADYGILRAKWEDEEYAYHVNFNDARQIKGAGPHASEDKPVLFRRPIAGGDCTYLNFNAKKYAAIRDAISGIPESAFQAALSESKSKEAVEAAERAAKVHAENLETLQNLAERYGYKLVKA
jgi:hypothetical protein